MPKIGKFLSIFFPLFLASIAVFLCIRNYTPGTYLLGWDSLHPEFNFSEAFRRVWEGVWRAEQGVGAIAAHSHMADSPRIIFLWLESFILPASFLRYSYIFLCLILGPLGVYFFLKYVFQKEKESVWVYPAAFLGALFYLLNLGTLQNFYVPFEMFPAAFAFIPWIALSGLRYLREGGKLNLVFWAAILILSSPMAYAATLWYASFAGLFTFLAAFALISSGRKVNIKRLLVLLLTAVFLNLYWILPNIYSIANQSGVISNASTNRLFSQEAFLRNRDYGDFKDILIQKNFLFGWRNFDFTNNKFTDLLGVWTKNLSNPIVLNVGYALSGIPVLGLFLGIIKRKKTALAFVPTLIFCLFFLININPPTGGLYSYLYNNYGIFAEGFRMPFSKFSILYELIASFYFGYFVFVILIVRSRLLAIIKFIFFGAVVAGLVYFMLPAFSGWLIGPNVRKTMPGEYQQMFNWFNSNSYGRVALLPINSKYGWEYRSWGYEGSGFLTYGISDPVLYRDFDRWSIGNEDFYTQSAFALYANDTQAFVNTLKKYQVKYLLLDESIINPGGTPDILKIPQLKSIFAESGISEVAKFGFLTIYETGFGSEVSAPSIFTQTTFDLSYSPVDPLYATAGAYINTGNVTPVRKIPGLPSGNPVVSENLSINRGFANAYNCDLEKSGSVFKSNSSSGILLRAEGGGASCDYLDYPNLKYNQAYVLRVAGENRQGRSLKIYLFNEDSQVPEIEEILPSGKFDKTFFVYPHNQNVEGTGPARIATQSVAGGYILNLETRSFGRIPSENLLTKVEFYPVDSAYLQNLQGYSPERSRTGAQNNLKILDVKKYGTWGYKVETNGSGLLELGQGYEKGWIGLTKYDSGIKVLDHVKVNSWANGWMVESSTVYLYYWPQALEWGGGILGLFALLIIL
jgi:hypothetical protein